MKPERRLRPLSIALEDHGEEGIAILTAEPRRLMLSLVVAIFGLVVAGLAWSFVGRADVIVTANGTYAPEAEVRRVYAPIDGELADIFIAEGQPVSQGDVVARLNARGAIEAATSALEARLKLDDAEREWKDFPEKKALMVRKAEALKAQLEVAEHQHEQRVSEGTTKLAEGQKAELEEARSALDSAAHARDAAKQELDKYTHLFEQPGGGGIAELQVAAKRNAYVEAENNARVAQAHLAELDFRLSHEYEQAKAVLETSDQESTNLKIQYDEATRDIEDTEDKLRLQLQTARLVAEAAARIKFENIDKDNFLLIVAPVSGVITDVTSTQRGDKVQANMPLGAIAPKDARAVVKIEIAERDRAFLREGQPVKLKFNAFPYQRYGAIDGTLEYISPATKPSAQDKQPVYEGRVALSRNDFEVAGKRYPLRYGMTASAEVIVRERRLIDLGLDPFRELAG
ncbi:HlyD family efflux transporter periplasmic adaptor subunit [Pararobbsia silviterrae]|uniref:HlyD family efflux transporter periplasmic adaptor subunit n=1 Tax=Pararobbsia silviterrae TaxID=1792498 RepID=A0A494XRT3_9BURK|nr:HlyD family efflux transporter periplasmic adaptor subunit [Pararobbsia silviterrae]RKP53340.1 HlyD family efflux transporter periplasmic adaptor subunit [Pararobbsia silviterrae]